ncbi:MAG TPA: class I SAM-dependent methyltransferase [Saprospiraceae bacterium]|nr:class I SAM-dependent methyltransferase [Saprospiraceae bacterium]
MSKISAVTYKIKQYINYYKSAKTIYNIQSPSVFDIVTHIFDFSKQYYCFWEIETQRKVLVQNQDEIEFIELGAGSHKFNNHVSRKITDIAKSSLSSPHQGQILFNLANYFNAQNILEIGTSLGISTAYLAKANSQSKVITVDGNNQVLQIAKNLFQNLSIENIKVIHSEFDTFFSSLDSLSVPSFDLIFLDGNHAYEATIHYFYKLLPYFNANTIIVLDDIHWSAGMTKAWNELLNHNLVSLAIDYYDCGIIFLNNQLPNEKIAYIPFWKKPWRIGLFG